MRDVDLQIRFDSSSPRLDIDRAGELNLQFNLEDENESLAGQEREFLLPFASRRRSRHASGAIHAMI